jgi:hypothetical protein
MEAVQARAPTPIGDILDCVVATVVESRRDSYTLVDFLALKVQIRREIAGELTPIIEMLRQGDLRLLTVSRDGVRLNDGALDDEALIVDIAHESLSRYWNRATEWVREERICADALHEILRNVRARRPSLESGDAVGALQRRNALYRSWAVRYLRQGGDDWDAIENIIDEYVVREEDLILVARVPLNEHAPATGFDATGTLVSSNSRSDRLPCLPLPGARVPWSEFAAGLKTPEERQWLAEIEGALAELLRTRFGELDPAEEIFPLNSREDIDRVAARVLPISRFLVGLPVDDHDDKHARFYWNIISAFRETVNNAPYLNTQIVLTEVLNAPRALAEMRHFATTSVEFRYRIAIKYTIEFANAQSLSELASALNDYIKAVEHMESRRPPGSTLSTDPLVRLQEITAFFPAYWSDRIAIILEEWSRLRWQFDEISTQLSNAGYPKDNEPPTPDSRELDTTRRQLVEMLKRVRIIGWHFLQMATRQMNRQVSRQPL